MLLLERETDRDNQGQRPLTGFRLRLRGSNCSEQLISVPLGKTTIGSSPRCNVRIEQPAVHPLHCLIVFESDGLSVRRWATDTRLNGEPFEEASLTPGDCLTVGSVELLVEALNSQAETTPRSQDGCDSPRDLATTVHQSTVWLNDDQRTPWLNDADTTGNESQPAVDVQRDSYCWGPGIERTVVPFEAAKIVFRELQSSTAIARGRSRKLLAALRQNRDEYRRLAERVEDLECLMQAALFEQETMRLFAGDNDDAGGVESTILQRSVAVAPGPDGGQHAVDQLPESETARWKNELGESHEARRQLSLEIETLQRELNAVREHFTAAQIQIASWEQAGAAWDAERAQWNLERDEWHRQRDVLQQQIAESDIRLGDYLKRLESLDVELKSLRETRTSQPSRFDWSTPSTLKHDDAQLVVAVIQGRVPADSDWKPTSPKNEPSPAAHQYEDLATQPEPSSSAAAEESDLASFAEFSIWNQGAVTPPHSDNSVEKQSAAIIVEEQQATHGDAGEAALKQPQAESFIERYAHMFADEAAQPESQEAAVVPHPAVSEGDDEVRKPRNLGIVRRSPVPTPAGDEEESIEQYMAKLLQRVRGDGPRVSASQAPAGPNASSADEAATVLGQADEATASTTAPAWPIASGPVVDEDHVTTSLGTVRRKVPLAEQSADLEAFRALANESARRAISTHASRKHRRNAVTKAIVATLAGVTSLWMMLEAPHWQDLQFLTALVSLLVAAYWAGQTYRTLLETLRAAAYDGLKDLVEALRPQLPIDFEK